MRCETHSLTGCEKTAVGAVDDARHLPVFVCEQHATEKKGSGFNVRYFERMSGFEREHAAALLSLAADSFSNHGCNDYQLPNTDEGWALAQAMMAGLDERPRPPLDHATIYVEDWVLMRHLARRLEGEDDE